MPGAEATYERVGARSRLRPAVLAWGLAAAVALSGCEVEWGEATLQLEEPPPPERPEGEESDAESDESVPVPLPTGPFLWAVELDPEGGGRALPVASLTDAGLDTLGWPRRPPDGYRARFDSLHGAPGTELHLMSRGRRLGSLVLDGGGDAPSPGCPTTFSVRSLAPPGGDLPSLAFAVGAEGGGALPERLPGIEATDRMRTFGPILTERLFEEAGVGRAFLARSVDLRAVGFAGDTLPGMAATLLVGDTLAATPPTADSSASLFFLARPEGTGFEPTWSRLHTYRDAAGKQILVHQDWLPLSGGRVDLLRRVEAEGVRLAALRGADGDDGRIVWEEAEGCRSLDALDAGGS